MKNYWFLFWGYAVFWIGLAIFLGMLIRRQNLTRRKLDRLEREIEQRGSREG